MLAVTSIGMVSALGLDVVTSCAAARAGLRGSVALDEMQVLDPDAEALVPALGHRVPRLSAGLFGVARLLQLAIGAVDDLRQGWTPPSDRPVSLALTLPSAGARVAWLSRLRAEPDLAEGDIDLDAAERNVATFRERLGGSFLAQLADRGRIAVAPDSQRAFLDDQLGFIGALEQASAWIAKGNCDACWVGGIDSYLDPEMLEALAGLHVLRTPDDGVGLMPGEMACFLALEDLHRAKREGRKIWAVIDSFAQTKGATSRFVDDPPNSEPIAAAVASIARDRAPGVVLANLNGDAVRAMEWGGALVRLTSRGISPTIPVWIPPLYFGEIGAATGAASVALLARAFARGYAPAPRGVVALMSDGTSRGAFGVAAP
jgi:3-oxoacyl-[acyl-carrier-protein] synthase-1